MSQTFNTLQDYLKYYSDLLIIQYRELPKARGTVQIFANSNLCDGLPIQLRTCFNLDTAVGAQLDIIGKIVGVPRNVLGLDLQHTFFQFTRYGTANLTQGFGRYANVPYPPALFRRYVNNATYSMTDFELRYSIRLKILFNNAGSGWANIINGLWAIFGDKVLVQDGSSKVTYTVKQPYYNVFAVASYLNIVPKSMGCAVVINNV